VDSEQQKTQKIHEASFRKKESEFIVKEKKSEMKKGKEDLALLKKMREKEKEYAKEREAQQIKENKTLVKVNNFMKEDVDVKRDKTADFQKVENTKEKQAQNIQLINTLRVELRQIMLQNKNLEKAILDVGKKREEVTAKVNKAKKSDGIIELPGIKFSNTFY
jgi:hypothetical protein